MGAVAGHRGSECPGSAGRESSARISERRPEFNGGRRDWLARNQGRSNLPGLGPPALILLGGDARAISPSHQDAILGSAHVGDADGEPDPDRQKRDRERKSRDVGQHAVAKIVGSFSHALIACEVERFGRSVLMSRLHDGVASHLPRWGGIAWPKLEHTMLVRCNGPLGLHGSRLRECRMVDCVTRARRVFTEKGL
jgi:hypothetical protein